MVVGRDELAEMASAHRPCFTGNAGNGRGLLARVNVYEIMFHPIDSPRFESAEKAGIDSGDMVMAVEVNGARRAYPIREMAYHHVVNDVLGGEPIVATY